MEPLQKLLKRLKKIENWLKTKFIFDETIIMKPFDVGTSTYINFDAENNDKNPQFSIHDRVGISKYKICFCKG